jgi:hypothetical protein
LHNLPLALAGDVVDPYEKLKIPEALTNSRGKFIFEDDETN